MSPNDFDDLIFAKLSEACRVPDDQESSPDRPVKADELVEMLKVLARSEPD